MYRVAVLDLGTNVFNMLLASFSDNGCRYLKEYKCAAKLGADGLVSGRISESAFETASRAMELILQEIEHGGGADKIVPYATSAVREAENGPYFVEYMHNKFGIDIQVISGEREAELIFKGIIKSLPADLLKNIVEREEKILMLDIGGGSNEFIISDGESILWKQSFPIGMARMRKKFHYPEPIAPAVISDFEKFCNDVLSPLWSKIEFYKPTVFVGSSGSFDTFKDLMFGTNFREDQPSLELPMQDLCRLHELLLKSTAQERLQMPGMSPIRVDYIVLASVFTQMVLKKVSPEVIFQSAYSLKEGGMEELYREWNKF